MDISLPPGIYNPSNFCYIISTIQCLKNLRCIKLFLNQNQKFDYDINIILKEFNLKLMKKELFANKIKLIEYKIANNDEKTISIIENIKEKTSLSNEELQSYFTKLKCNNTNLYMYLEFHKLLMRLYTNKDTVLDMRDFIIKFRSVTIDNGNQYISRGQNDASEFLVFLIDYLHESHSSSVSCTVDDPKEKLSDVELEKLDLKDRIQITFIKYIKETVSNNYTSLINNLHHYILNMIKCSKCGYANLSNSMENILCLSLYQKDNKDNILSIYDTLDKHFDDEVLEGYSCDKCKNKDKNIISKKFLTFPDTFIICLKRTGYNVTTNSMEKINVTVEYPMILNLKKYYPKYLIKDEKDGVYKLKSVINQIGDNNCGHYFSFVYDESLDKWLLYNDEKVNVMNEDKVLNCEKAYLLFYEKI